MDAGLATILAAAITGGLALIGRLVIKFRQENRDDHAYVHGLLTMLHKVTTRIERRVERVDERLDDHIEFHAERQGVLDNVRPIHKNGTQDDPQIS